GGAPLLLGFAGGAARAVRRSGAWRCRWCRYMHRLLAIGARGESIQRPVADTITDQPQGREANCSSHPPDLTVSSLGDGQFEPGRWNLLPVSNRRMAWPHLGGGDGPGTGRSGHPVFQDDPSAQLVERCLSDLTLHLNPIGLRHFLVRAGNSVL